MKWLSEQTSINILVIGLVLGFPGIFILFNSGIIDIDTLAKFGDFTGGLVGSIWALAGVIMFYVALKEQKKDIQNNKKSLETQTEALKQQIAEFELQRIELVETRKTFKIDRFETTFFHLLNRINESSNLQAINVGTIKTVGNEKKERWNEHKGQSFFAYARKVIESDYHYLETWRAKYTEIEDLSSFILNYISSKMRGDVWREFESVLTDSFNKNFKFNCLKGAFFIFYFGFEGDLDKYMNNVFSIFKYIEVSKSKLDSLDYDLYISIVKGSLTQNELSFIWLYYQIFTENRKLLEKYSLIDLSNDTYKPRAFN